MISRYDYLVVNIGLLWTGTKFRLRFIMFADLKCRPPTDAEVDSLPHLIMTADVDWDPTSYDNVILDLHKFYDQDIAKVHHGNFDAHGNYLHRTVATHLVQPEPEILRCTKVPRI
jgi:hypothetical protein